MDFCNEKNGATEDSYGKHYAEGEFVCDREKDHLGSHQQLVVEDDEVTCAVITWDRTALNFKGGNIWTVTTCKDCSYRFIWEVADFCASCQIWNELETGKETYTIDGVIYIAIDSIWTPLVTFKHLTKKGVVELERKLIVGCDVPPSLRSRFPNDSIFRPVIGHNNDYAYVPFEEKTTMDEALELLEEYENWS